MMAAVGSCRICREEQLSGPSCRGGLLRRSRRLRHRTDGEEDRISAIPNDLLHLFLARLGCARTAAYTGLLSSRCRNLWTGLPELTFHNTAPDQVEAALTRVTRPSLSLLDIHISENHELEPPSVTSLLRSAARLAPAELKVVFSGVTKDRSNHLQPVEVELPCFDRTASISLSIPVVRLVLPLAGDFLELQSVSLRSCEINIADLLQRCPSLRKLCIHGNRLLSITAHSRSLEELDMTAQVGLLQRLDIQAPLLKKLSICQFGYQQ
ncbi:hypothetical protein BAE44_0014066 [Dichanthelium oligosanthes]|uniref:F-box domain-containing protein n=1 Tax=Dichanthelium oligosanthes TaxID=888268 RepID=A0A1E5VIL0_9POAL|nr:hypothetical protein BAE44_0014066 [Dichanthelium oligosanthes]